MENTERYGDLTGRAFADEIFRVFQRNHPSILLMTVNTVDCVEKMIAMAKGRETGYFYCYENNS